MPSLKGEKTATHLHRISLGAEDGRPCVLPLHTATSLSGANLEYEIRAGWARSQVFAARALLHTLRIIEGGFPLQLLDGIGLLEGAVV